ncbi:MHC class II regulatory factor RFX1 [Patagioenas fasciata]|uniref:MHC class II regulatory factor RFX1 n=1 Tax=Patagioenas fasciata TaxID=372321 RepID=UPI003A994299
MGYYSPVQSSTAQYKPVQPSTIQYSPGTGPELTSRGRDVSARTTPPGGPRAGARAPAPPADRQPQRPMKRRRTRGAANGESAGREARGATRAATYRRAASVGEGQWALGGGAPRGRPRPQPRRVATVAPVREHGGRHSHGRRGDRAPAPARPRRPRPSPPPLPRRRRRPPGPGRGPAGPRRRPRAGSPPVAMATQTYVTELTSSQQQQAPPPPAPTPFGAELPGGPAPQAPPPPPPAPPAPPPQQFIVVTVSAESALRASEGVAEGSPAPPAAPPAGPSPGVPGTQCSPAPTGAAAPKPQEVTPLPHVYPTPYVEGGDGSYPPAAIRSGSFPFAETPLYTPNAGAAYYEGGAAAGGGPVQPSPPPPSSQAPPPVYVPGGGGGAAAGGGGPILGSAPPPPPAAPAAPPPAAAAAPPPPGGTYVIQGGYVLGGGAQSYSHTTRASPVTVQWLLENYEAAEGVSLPRSTLYCHYLLHCQAQKLEPVNAASFGKLIRSVFVGLRTRRLGTRGNSKYHYYGLRIKGSSPLLRLMEDQQHLAMRQQPFAQKQRLKPIQKVEGGGVTNGVTPQPPPGLSDISAQVQQYQQFLDASRPLGEFPALELQGKPLPDGAGAEDLKAFQLLYREHCEAIVDVMINLQFPLVETLWKTFWRCGLGQAGDATAPHEEAEKRLPKGRLVLLSKFEPLLRWVRDCDHALYQGLVEMLIPDVLRPIPSALTQAVRNFAKSLESWLTGAMVNIPEEMVRVKVAAAGAFAQTLRRYTSLNHLAQAARAVLQNTAQINQMLSDLNRVDFANVQEQASWVCRCRAGLVSRLEQDFKATLQQQHSLEQWAAWLDGVVGRVLRPHLGSAALPRHAKRFLLKWSFYSSMVIRDLTLRSAASFGSFHLIRLLYDEYMYYLVEQRVARARGQSPIAVMGEFANLSSSFNALDAEKDEEEEEDEESEEELPQELPLGEGPALPPAPLEPPPAKLPRTDRGLFVQALPSS